jgi:hypothetical protein
MRLINIAFNAFGCNYDQEKLLLQAEAMVQYGLVEAGYNSIIFDDCFTAKERSEDGRLLPGLDPNNYVCSVFTLVNPCRSRQMASRPPERNAEA